jgi:hypothetical protein
MRSRDLRTLSLSELVHDARVGKYKNAFLENAYAGLPEVVAWLALQLGTNGDNIDKTVILDQLHAGDQFYSDLFRSQGLLPADLNPELYGDPLSETVDKILQAITGKRLRGYSDAIIYDYLKEAVLTELARLLARDNRYNSHAEWQSLIERFGSSSTFYIALVSAIPETTIHLHKTALAPPYDPSDVLHYLSQGYTRMDRASFHREYLKRIEQGPSLLPSELVGKLTEGADSMMLNFDEMLKQDLVRRLGPEDEVAWIDGLRWPLVQAAAINEYQELAELAALVHQLVGRRDQLQSNFVQLLLIMFQQYIGLMRRISFNLNSFESSVNPYAGEPFFQQLYEEGRSRLEAWKVQGIKDAAADLLAPLLAIEGPTDETQRALFDWVTAQDRERWLNTVQSGITLPIIDQFHEHYLGAFLHGKWPKAQLLRTIETDPVNWKQFKLLYSLWESEGGDEAFRKRLVGQMDAFIGSDQFAWNTGYIFDNDRCEQALHLTDLYFRSPHSLAQLTAMTRAARTWHEGWSYHGPSEMKDNNRYIFLLTCGMCLAYLHYNSGDAEGATTSWESTLGETISQYRSAGPEMFRQRYLLPIRLFFHTLIKFDKLALSGQLEALFKKVDHIEDRIELAHGLMETTRFLDESLPAELREKIGTMVQEQYWVFKLRLQHAKHPEHVQRYEMMYKAAMAWLSFIEH